jgi:ABC-type nitrate/sulfonate/bicarbonate transport system substrate-binding protein
MDRVILSRCSGGILFHRRWAPMFRAVTIALIFVTANVMDDAHAQKAGPAIRLGVAGISGSNSYPYVSKQLNLFAKYNVDVELVVFQGGTQMTQAMVSGDLPLGLIDGPPVMAANLAGANLVMIAGNINTFPYTIISKSEFRNALDLKGKRIGISRYGSSSDTAVRLTLERQNLKPDRDAAILQIGGQSERFAALRAGAIDATIVSPPFNLVARRLGFKDLIDISEMGIPYAHLQVAARVDFVDRYPDQVVRFLKGLIEGTSYWKDPSKKELVIQAVASFLKLDREKDREQLDETFRYYGKIFPARPYPTVEGMEYAAELLKKSRPDAKNLHAKDYVVNRFIDELEKEGFLSQLYGGH